MNGEKKMWSSVKGKNRAWKKNVPLFYAVQIFYMPGVLVNELW